MRTNHPMAMRTWLPILLFLIAASGCVPADRSEESEDPPTAPLVDDETTRRAVEAVLERQEQAIREADMAVLDTLWSSGEDVYIFEQGGVDSSWAAYRDHHLGPELETLEDLDFRHEDVQIRTGGGLAVATGRYVLMAHHDGQDIESRGVFTTAFKHEGDGWKIVHSHLSRRPRR